MTTALDPTKLLPAGRYLDIDGGYRIHCIEEDGGDPTVVFLHGSGPGASGHSNFQFNYPVFAAAGCRTLVPDHIGYGLSSKPDNVRYTLDFFTDALMAALDQLGVDRFTPIGNSLGGAIALDMALRHPERIERLILMAPGGVEEQQSYFAMPGMAAMREFFVSGVTPDEDNLAAMLKHLVYDPAHITPELTRQRLAVHREQTPTVITTMAVPNMTERLGEIRCPVLVFWGADESFMPLSGALHLAQGCPDCRVILQSACGHWVMVEHRELFNQSCLDFLGLSRQS